MKHLWMKKRDSRVVDRFGMPVPAWWCARCGCFEISPREPSGRHRDLDGLDCGGRLAMEVMSS